MDKMMGFMSSITVTGIVKTNSSLSESLSGARFLIIQNCASFRPQIDLDDDVNVNFRLESDDYCE